MSEITIALVGDIYPTRSLLPVPPLVGRAYDVLQQADVVVANFEIPLSDRGAPVQKLLNIRADSALAADLPILGLDIVTVANNHAVDYGWPALEHTIELLRANGIKVVGAGETIVEAMRHEIVEHAGKRIGVVGMSALLPTGMDAAETRPGIAPLHVNTAYEIDPYYQMEEPGDLAVVKVRTSVRPLDLERAVAAIRSLKQQCDVAVASVHWGFGSGETLAEYQLPLAQALIEAGADIVHGHHPHAIHAIGFHMGKPIFFSPNVFVGQQVFLDAPPAVHALWAEMSADGYVARVAVAPDGGLSVEAIPTILNADRLPVLAEGADFDRIRHRLARLSKAYGAVVEGDRTLSVRPA